MSKQTIKDAIAKNIAKQGNQVDISGQLAGILEEIVDEIPAPAPAQEQSDWNEADTESPAYIKNKPSIPATQEQADWNESDTDSPAYIKNKPNLTIPVLEVTIFAAGEVTTEEELFSKIKLNGTNITSLDQLKELRNKQFFMCAGNPEEVLLVPTYRFVYESDEVISIQFVSTSMIADFSGVNLGIAIENNGGDFSDSSVFLNEA